MEKEKTQRLIDGLNAGTLDSAERAELEALIEAGMIELSALQGLAGLERQVNAMPTPEPSQSLDRRFYEMLAVQKHRQLSRFSWAKFFSAPELMPRLAFASVALIAGIAIGYVLRPASTDGDYRELTTQVSELKEMMMLALLEKESATERLKAVNLTQEMDRVSSTVTSALISTLNNDENVNVRLAALEALVPYVRDSSVRTELIRSIGKQESPLVQVALAELMAQIQERSSVQELQKIIQSEKTPAEIKQRIRESIKVLS